MDDLIAELEAAESGSRALSDKVLLACGWQLIADPGGMLPWPKWFDPNGKRCGDNVTTDSLKLRPSVTESVDAALTLVPEGWHRKFYSYDEVENPVWGAELESREIDCKHCGTGSTITVCCPGAGSLALAVCVAALRAHERKKAAAPEGGREDER